MLIACGDVTRLDGDSSVLYLEHMTIQTSPALDPATLARIVAATTRPESEGERVARLERTTYVQDRKVAQGAIHRGLVARGLPFKASQGLAVASLQYAAKDAVDNSSELAGRLPARARVKIEARGQAAATLISSAGDRAQALIVAACRDVVSDMRMRAGVRELCATIIRVMT